MKRNGIFLCLLTLLGSQTARPMTRLNVPQVLACVTTGAAIAGAWHFYHNRSDINFLRNILFNQWPSWGPACHPDLNRDRYKNAIEANRMPSAEKHRIDSILQKQEVIQALASLRNPHSIVQHYHAWRTCRKYGVYFQGNVLIDLLLFPLNRHFPNVRNIFTIASIPEYYFKMGNSYSGFHDDQANIMRFVNAHEIRNHSEKPRELIIPQKWFYEYGTNQQTTSSPSSMQPPPFIIVTQKIDLTKSKKVPLDHVVHRWIYVKTPINDLNSNNIRLLPDGSVALIDTESSQEMK